MIYSKQNTTSERLEKELKSIAHRLKCKDINELLYFPKYFQVETVRRCNANCLFCPKNQWDISVPYMSDTLFTKIVKELKEYSEWITFVDLQRNGEPLLDKKLPERVYQLKQAGIKCVLFSTNASLLTEDTAIRLLESGLDEIMLSIDSINKDIYEKLRVGLKFEKVLKNILTFFRLREKIKPDMVIRVRGVSFFDFNNNEDFIELEKWVSYWTPFKKSQDRIYMKRSHNWGNQKEIDGYNENPEVFHPCILPWSTMHITTKGIATICPHDYNAIMNIGDVNQFSIKELWNNNKINHIRMLHETGNRNEITLCHKCVTFDPDYSLENISIKE